MKYFAICDDLNENVEIEALSAKAAAGEYMSRVRASGDVAPGTIISFRVTGTEERLPMVVICKGRPPIATALSCTFDV